MLANLDRMLRALLYGLALAARGTVGILAALGARIDPDALRTMFCLVAGGALLFALPAWARWR